MVLRCMPNAASAYPQESEQSSLCVRLGLPHTPEREVHKQYNQILFLSLLWSSQSIVSSSSCAVSPSHFSFNIIGRKNLTMEHFSALMEKYNAVGIPTYSELILGLPGETKDSFCRGLCKLLESGQHNSLSVYYLEMLPNSDIADKGYIQKHGIQVIKVPFNHIHSAIK